MCICVIIHSFTQIYIYTLHYIGDQGDIWKQVTIPISSDMTFKIAIEAFRGTGYKGDIAIDDISFTPGCKPDFTATLTPDRLTPFPDPQCPGKFR